MIHRGDVPLGATVDIKFNTRQSSGALTTIAGSPVVVAYIDNSTTELTAGITLTVDFDGRTGLHNLRIVASAANGYAAFTDVTLVFTAGTVNGVSLVGEILAAFSIQNRAGQKAAS
jgi:hypothetical protein